jgi:TolA-binding protein
MMTSALASVALAATLPHAAQAQDVTARVGRLEGEMRAVQRKVFPGGAGQYLQPEVNDQVPPAPVPGSPSSSAVVDLTSRVASLEGQMATLTGQTEQNGYRLRQMQDAFDAYRRATDAKLAAVGTAGGPVAVGTAGAPVADEMGPPTPRPSAPRPQPAARPPRGAPTAVDLAADADVPARSAPVAATGGVDRPSTGDAAEDDYIYGYRLWQAKQYPAAEAQLKKVVAAYPGNRRASYAQNLLGRSYLDDGKPSLASVAFYDNYKKMPDGERAPESLYYLAQALMKLNKPADACKVYGELSDVYGSKVGAAMKADVVRGRAAAKCP